MCIIISVLLGSAIDKMRMSHSQIINELPSYLHFLPFNPISMHAIMNLFFFERFRDSRYDLILFRGFVTTYNVKFRFGI
jgi:hypothetical protein